MAIVRSCLQMGNIFSFEYKSFRKNIDWIWQDNQPTDKETLRRLMRDKGMHEVKGERESPTTTQLELAWNYILNNKVVTKIDDLPKQQYVTIKSYTYKRGKKTIRVKSYKKRVKYKMKNLKG